MISKNVLNKLITLILIFFVGISLIIILSDEDEVKDMQNTTQKEEIPDEEIVTSNVSNEVIPPIEPDIINEIKPQIEEHSNTSNIIISPKSENIVIEDNTTNKTITEYCYIYGNWDWNKAGTTKIYVNRSIEYYDSGDHMTNYGTFEKVDKTEYVLRWTLHGFIDYVDLTEDCEIQGISEAGTIIKGIKLTDSSNALN